MDQSVSQLVVAFLHHLRSIAPITRRLAATHHPRAAELIIRCQAAAMPPRKRAWEDASDGGATARRVQSSCSSRGCANGADGGPSGGGSLPPLLSGPATREEVFAWPSDLLDRLATGPGGPERCFRLMGNAVDTEWHMISDYSGFDCPRESLRAGSVAMGAHWGWRVPQPQMLRACDFDKLPQGVLIQYANKLDQGRSCVFHDINDRLPTTDREALDKMEPPSKCSKAEAGRARASQAAYIQEHKARIFTAESRSYCLIHGGPCPTLPQLPVSSSSRKRIRANVAGTCCQGWSKEGKQLREGHPSERPHSIWQAEREQAAQLDLEDGFIQECTPAYPSARLTEAFSRTHWIFRIKAGPETIGYPSRRLRSFVIAFAKARFVWMGPQTTAEVQAEYDSIFRRSVMATGDAYMNASPEEAHEEMKRLAAVQRNFWPAEFDSVEAIKHGENILQEI